MKKNETFNLKNIFLIILVTIYIIIILSPFIIKLLDFPNYEIAEFVLLILLLSLGFLAQHLYRKESIKYESEIYRLKQDRMNLEDRMEDAFKYIGSMNVRMQELESIFTKIQKYPETKQEIKKILQYFTEKVLSIVNAEWVLFRVVEMEGLKTLSEVFFARDKNRKYMINISNKQLKGNIPVDNHCIISSTDETFRINTYYIIPGTVNREQKMMIETIANQAEMLFIIYSSVYYKNRDIELPK